MLPPRPFTNASACTLTKPSTLTCFPVYSFHFGVTSSSYAASPKTGTVDGAAVFGGFCSVLTGLMTQRCPQEVTSLFGISAVRQTLPLFFAGAACQLGVFAPPSPVWYFLAATKDTHGDPGVGLKLPQKAKLIILPFCRRNGAPTIKP